MVAMKPKKRARARTGLSAAEAQNDSVLKGKVGRSATLEPNARLNFDEDKHFIHPKMGTWKTFERLAALAARLTWWFGLPGKWCLQVLRLLCFVILMLPGFVPPFFTYLFSKGIKKNIVYGPRFRHQLDLYIPEPRADGHKFPVVIFISGGAWIIGYKAWGFIMGQIFRQCGVLFIAPDYRNFPEVTVGDMVNDVITAVDWVFEHIDGLKGDRDNVTLMGQSAGAHLSGLAMLQRAEEEEASPESVQWSASELARWVGISGPYDIVDVLPSMKKRGLPLGVIMALMDSDLHKFSMTHRVRDLKVSDKQRVLESLPPAYLFHGKADETCPWTQAEKLEEVYKSAQLEVKSVYYEGKSHTDPILEDPVEGPGDPLMSDLLELVAPDAPRSKGGFWRLQPKLLLKWAKIFNPF